MAKIKFIFPCLALIILASGCAGHRFIKMPEQAEATLPELAERMKAKRVVFIGEVHSSTSNHRMQLQVIEALHEAGFPMAVGIEMFRADSQKELDRWLAGGLDDEAFLKVYRDNWQMPWQRYRDIFLYAKRNNIPLVGLNIPWGIIRQVVKGGVKSLKPEDSAGLTEVTCDVDESYQRLIREALDEHEHEKNAADKETAFKNFCEAQVVWDVSMARRIAGYLKENPGRNMVVLSGSAHSRKNGIPRNLSRLAGAGPDAAYIILLPGVNDILTPEDITAEDADYIWTDPWGWLEFWD